MWPSSGAWPREPSCSAPCCATTRPSPPADSTPGIERLERDVLTHEGVTDVIVFMGTNDIRRGASAAQVTGGLSQIVQRVKQRGSR